MSSVQTLISEIQQDYCPEIARTDLLSYLYWAVRKLFNQNSAQSLFYNSQDTFFPFCFLKTTSKVLEYEITSANLVDSSGSQIPLAINGVTVRPRRIRHVFVSDKTISLAQYTPRFYGGEVSIYELNPYYRGILYSNTFTRINGSPIPVNDNRGPAWRFFEDPGSNTSLFYVEFWYEHPPITSETGVGSTLLIDSDRWEDALIDGVVGRVEDLQNGSSQRLQKFKDYWVKNFLGEANEGFEQRKPLVHKTREMG